MGAATSSAAPDGVRCDQVATTTKLKAEYPLTIDTTGRISWPGEVENAFGKTLVFARWLNHCLIAAPEETWLRIAQRSESAEPTPQDMFMQRLTAGAQKVTIDNNGRCLVPRHLRGWAHLDDKGPVTVSAQGNWVEVWSTPKFDAYLDAAMASAEPQIAASMRLGPPVAAGAGTAEE